MSKSFAECPCGKTTLSIELPDALDKYTPRQCDCDFCTARKIAYLSHPDGVLEITSSEPLLIQRQGSNQAMFLSCSSCETVIAATIQAEDDLIGALNSGLLSNSVQLQESTVVSPKLLSPGEKLERWQGVWLKVKVNGNNSI